MPVVVFGLRLQFPVHSNRFSCSSVCTLILRMARTGVRLRQGRHLQAIMLLDCRYRRAVCRPVEQWCLPRLMPVRFRGLVGRLLLDSLPTLVHRSRQVSADSVRSQAIKT